MTTAFPLAQPHRRRRRASRASSRTSATRWRRPSCPRSCSRSGLPPDAAARVVGFIEGTADLLSNAVKLVVGWYSDRIGKRKAFVVGGYALTGSAFALCALAIGWPLVLVAKSLAWIGKGLRGPLRNAILADAVEPKHRGKAFGFHRAGDTLGAIAGPLIASALIAWMPAHWFKTPDEPYRVVFLVTLIPGLGAALAFALLIREQRFTPKPGLRLGASVKMLPAGFRRFLAPVFVFGLGDFSHALLILAATVLLDTGVRAAGRGRDRGGALRGQERRRRGSRRSRPVARRPVRAPPRARRRLLPRRRHDGRVRGAVRDRNAKRRAGSACCSRSAGVYVAIQEALEPAITADLVPDKAIRGTAIGVLATVNGLGDFVAERRRSGSWSTSWARRPDSGPPRW